MICLWPERPLWFIRYLWLLRVVFNRSIGCCFLLHYMYYIALYSILSAQTLGHETGISYLEFEIIRRQTTNEAEPSRDLVRFRPSCFKSCSSSCDIDWDASVNSFFGLRIIVWATGRVAWPQMPFLLKTFWPVYTAFERLYYFLFRHDWRLPSSTSLSQLIFDFAILRPLVSATIDESACFRPSHSSLKFTHFVIPWCWFRCRIHKIIKLI